MKLSKVGQQKFMNDSVWNAEEERDFLRLHVRETFCMYRCWLRGKGGVGNWQESRPRGELLQTRPGDSNRKDKTLAQPSKEESNTV